MRPFIKSRCFPLAVNIRNRIWRFPTSVYSVSHDQNNPTWRRTWVIFVGTGASFNPFPSALNGSSRRQFAVMCGVRRLSRSLYCSEFWRLFRRLCVWEPGSHGGGGKQKRSRFVYRAGLSRQPFSIQSNLPLKSCVCVCKHVRRLSYDLTCTSLLFFPLSLPADVFTSPSKQANKIEWYVSLIYLLLNSLCPRKSYFNSNDVLKNESQPSDGC